MSKPQRDPSAAPLGCVLAVLTLLLIFNSFGLVGVLAGSAGLPPGLSLTVAGLVVAPVLGAELFGAIYLRRRNRYAARTLAWSLAITVGAIALALVVTTWLDRVNGL